MCDLECGSTTYCVIISSKSPVPMIDRLIKTHICEECNRKYGGLNGKTLVYLRSLCEGVVACPNQETEVEWRKKYEGLVPDNLELPPRIVELFKRPL